MKRYLRHRICNVIDVKELIALGYLGLEKKYHDYVETHDFWELCYMRNDGLKLSLEDKTLELAGHQLVLISPNKKHSYFFPKSKQCCAFVVCFDSFSHTLMPLRETIFSLDGTQMDCMEKIMEECTVTFRMTEIQRIEGVPAARFGGQQALLLQLEYLLISLVRSVSVTSSPELCCDENFYAELSNVMIEFLQENIYRKLTLNHICNKFNYSRSFLCKVFKEQTGETLIACFNRLKMEEAARLLVETSKSVTNIAYSLGICDVKYFNVMFKRHTGISPVTYRKQAHKALYR